MPWPQKIKHEENARPLEAAKWFQLPLLLGGEELEELLLLLGPIFIVKTLSKVDEGQAILSVSDFISLYKEYADTLKNGRFPDPKRFRSAFSSVITNDLDALFSMPVAAGSELIKVKLPVIQMQYHTMTWSEEEGKFRSQLFGSENIPWGLLFSYPQIILDPRTKEIVKADQTEFSNSQLFKKIQGYQREKTVPTPFLVQEKRINTPQRLGKGCFSWINNHPSLQKLNITVRKPF